MADSDDRNDESEAPARTSRRSLGFLLILGVLGIAMVARAVIGGSGKGGGAPRGGSDLVPAPLVDTSGSPTPPSETLSDRIAEALPYITEGSFAALVGFAIGFTSKKLVKLGLVLLALVAVGLFALSEAGVVVVDWQRGIDLLNGLVLNVKENAPVADQLLARLPSAGGFVAGYVLGYRRG